MAFDRLIHDWQHLPFHLNPNLFSFGSFQIRYYSLMYVVAFFLTYALVLYRIRHEGYDYKKEMIQDYAFWAILGVILGGRLGYVFFYNFAYYIRHPLEIILPFEFSHGIHFVGITGMSYHGGVIGVTLATIYFCKQRQVDIWRFADLLVSVAPLGYTFGRIGNFINGELYGRATSVPWGMYFPLDYTGKLRHPSQLYEAFFEGIFLFVILWTIRKKSSFDGFLIAFYLIGYGVARFFIEFYREPDIQLGFVWNFLSMGQVLCLLMILAGGGIFFYTRGRRSESNA